MDRLLVSVASTGVVTLWPVVGFHLPYLGLDYSIELYAYIYISIYIYIPCISRSFLDHRTYNDLFFFFSSSFFQCVPY